MFSNEQLQVNNCDVARKFESECACMFVTSHTVMVQPNSEENCDTRMKYAAN